MNLNCPEIRRPDLCIFLDLSPDESLARIGRERTHTEIYEKKEILEAVRRQFLHVFAELDDKTVIIDTTGQSIDEVAALVSAAVETL
jgi:dTMP kinase